MEAEDSHSSKVNMSQQHAPALKKASSNLACINRIIASKSKEAIVTLHLALIGPHLEYCIQLSDSLLPQVQQSNGLTGENSLYGHQDG